MTTQIKVIQRTLDDLNERLLANAWANIEVTQYIPQPKGVILCRMFLRNGMIVEGYATQANNGKGDARLRAIKQVLLIEQYLEAERLYQAAAKESK